MITKHFLLCLIFPLACCTVVAQNDFIGVAKYKIMVEGDNINNGVTDSMSVIFSTQKVKVILYLPDMDRPGHVVEKSFIDDFRTKKSIALNNGDKTYKTDTLKTTPKYDFINTMKFGASNNVICLIYKADSVNFDTTQVASVHCLCSIDYRNSSINNYFFLGSQPVIIDNRIVMDFIVTRPDGVKQRIYIADIKKKNDVDNYFSVAGYEQQK